MHAGIIFLLVIVGSVLFHIFTPWYWTDIASNWQGMDDTITLTFWVGGGVFVAVCLFMVYCVFKFSYKEGRTVEYKPEDKKLERILTWATTLGVAALLAPGLIIWNQYVNVPKNALEVDVMAWQWGWQYRLPGEDGKLGTTKVININDDNPFGINPNDPFGQDDVIIQSDVLNMETDRPIKILLRSVDVLHNWYVPQFRAKMDAVPGTITFYWFEPNKVGEYEVLCAEYCGVGHYAMRGSVIVQSKQDYNSWLNEQETFSELVAKQNKLKIEENKIAKKINLGEFIEMDDGTEATGGRDSSNILSDCCESIIAALYLDGGLSAAKKYIGVHWGCILKETTEPPKDAKTSLQEWAQGKALPLPTYTEKNRSGPDHGPKFVFEVEVKGHIQNLGKGHSKRSAQQAAALAAIKQLGIEH